MGLKAFPPLPSGTLRGKGIISTSFQRKRLRFRAAQGAELRLVLGTADATVRPCRDLPRAADVESWVVLDESSTVEPTFLPRARHLHKPQV